jgi:hypothetical protein
LVAITLAWVVAVLSTAALVAVSTAVEQQVDGGSDPNTFAWTLGVLILVTSSVGLVLVAQRPGNRIGLLLASGATLLAWAFTAYGVAALRFVSDGPTDLAGGLASLLGQVLIIPSIFLTFVASALLFPDGRLPGQGWHTPVRLVVGAIALGTILTIVSPWARVNGLPDNPLALPLPTGVADVAGGLSAAALIGGLVMGVMAIAVRYRRSTGIERAQVKWLLAAIAIAALVFPLSWATDVGPDDGGLIDVVSIVAMCLVPLAILVAILRYRLYDIDRLVSRTVSWAIVTGGLVVVFGAMVIGLQGLLDGLTQRDTVAIAVSTLVAAALFQPVRRRVQRAVDRRFDRARYDAERTAQAFGQRLQHEVDLERLAGELRTTVGAAVRPTTATIWLADRRER